VDKGVIVFAIEFDEFGEVELEIDEESCSIVLDIVACKLKPQDDLFVLNSE
jgi:hypothetical protein